MAYCTDDIQQRKKKKLAEIKRQVQIDAMDRRFMESTRTHPGKPWTKPSTISMMEAALKVKLWNLHYEPWKALGSPEQNKGNVSRPSKKRKSPITPIATYCKNSPVARTTPDAGVAVPIPEAHSIIDLTGDDDDSEPGELHTCKRPRSQKKQKQLKITPKVPNMYQRMRAGYPVERCYASSINERASPDAKRISLYHLLSHPRMGRPRDSPRPEHGCPQYV